MAPLDEHDDDFAVWPFRRQLVDGLARGDGPHAPASPEATQPFHVPWQARRRRSSPGPLRLAIPTAAVTFCAAVAAAAAVGDAHDVPARLQVQIVPAAEAAAPAATPERHVLRALFVPDVVGLQRRQAVRRLSRYRFHPRVRLVPGKPGRVVGQKPRAATEVRKAGTVLVLVGHPKPKPQPERAAPKLVVAPRPTPTVIVTAVVGLPQATARTALANEGLRVRVYPVPSARPAGTVVAQSPRSGRRAEAGSAVRINVAARP